MSRRPEVIYAEPNILGKLFTDPNDPHFSKQWAMKNEGTAAQGGGTNDSDIDAEEAWEITTGSSAINIAIVDAGMQTNHQDFTGRVIGDIGDNHYHGTAVAGIAAAQGNNSVGVAGVAWNVGIINEDLGAITIVNATNAIQSAINRNAHVINNSYGFDQINNSFTLYRAFTDAYKMNLTTVAAMGNDGNDLYPQSPANFGRIVIAVGATKNTDSRKANSSTGPHIDVVAPGGSGKDFPDEENIFTTLPGDSYDNKTFIDGKWEPISGTSFSTPVVSGISALLLSFNPSLYNDDIRQIIRISAEDKGPSGFDNEYGEGRVNARAALDSIRSPNQLNHWFSTGGTVVSSLWNNYQEFYGLPGLGDGTYIVERHEVEKTVSFPSSFSSTPHVWGRGVASNGYSKADPNFTMGYCEVVPGTITNTSVRLRTYVYDIYIEDPVDGFPDYWDTYPCDPGQVVFAYNALGTFPPLAVSISGPLFLDFKETGYYTVNVTGGNGSIGYQWKIKNDGSSIWSNLGISQSQQVTMGTTSFTMKVEVTRGSESDFETKYVQYNSGGFNPKILLLPQSYSLSQNHPNPFNPTTTIKYELPEASSISLVIYDLRGNEVTRWTMGNERAGYKRKTWNGTDTNGNRVPAGVYIYKLTARSMESDQIFTNSRKMVLMK